MVEQNQDPHEKIAFIIEKLSRKNKELEDQTSAYEDSEKKLILEGADANVQREVSVLIETAKLNLFKLQEEIEELEDTRIRLDSEFQERQRKKFEAYSRIEIPRLSEYFESFRKNVRQTEIVVGLGLFAAIVSLSSKPSLEKHTLNVAAWLVLTFFILTAIPPLGRFLSNICERIALQAGTSWRSDDAKTGSRFSSAASWLLLTLELTTLIISGIFVFSVVVS